MGTMNKLFWMFTRDIWSTNFCREQNPMMIFARRNVHQDLIVPPEFAFVTQVRLNTNPIRAGGV